MCATSVTISLAEQAKAGVVGKERDLQGISRQTLLSVHVIRLCVAELAGKR
jgi:hypothetical protein